jgi:hypothetical protein
MNVKNIFSGKIICLVILLTFLMSSCGQQKQDQSQNQQQQQTSQGPEQIPNDLTEIETNIEKIILALNGPAVGVKEEKPESGKQGEASGQSDQSQGTQAQGTQPQGAQAGQPGQESQQPKQGEGAKQPPKQSPWEKITPIIYEIHNKWNSFMPLAAKKGANKALLDGFSDALNNLTNTLPGKNENNTLLAANITYRHIPDLYLLFKPKVSPEIKKIRYYIRNSVLNSQVANWSKADTDLSNLKASWALFKNTTTKEQQDSANMLDFSIYELDKVLKTKSLQLVKIKGKVALSNVEALEKSSQEASSQGGK